MDTKSFQLGFAVASAGKIIFSSVSGGIDKRIVDIDFNKNYNIVVKFSDGTSVTVLDVKFDSDGKIIRIRLNDGAETGTVICDYDGDYLQKINDVVLSNIDKLGIETVLNLQTKHVSPGDTEKIVVADNGYDGLEKVVVDATNTGGTGGFTSITAKSSVFQIDTLSSPKSYVAKSCIYNVSTLSFKSEVLL